MSLLQKVREAWKRGAERERSDKELERLRLSLLKRLIYALDSSARLKILYELREEAQRYSSLKNSVKVVSTSKTDGSFSHHRRELLKAGLIKQDGDKYHLTGEGKRIWEMISELVGE